VSKIKVVLVQRRGEVEGLYASEPVDLLYLDWATDSDAPASGAVLAKIESAPLADLPDAVADVFCTRDAPHPHQGDRGPLDIPEAGEPEDAEPGAEALPAMPMTDEVRAILERQEERFIETFGRSPGPWDPVFFDPHADEPRLLNDEVLDTALLEAMHRAGVHPALIYAYQKTGRMVTAENVEHLTQAELEEWHAAVDEWFERHEGDRA
jgi:hypothetical protein